MYLLFSDTSMSYSRFYEFYSTNTNFILVSAPTYSRRRTCPKNHHNRIAPGVTIPEETGAVSTCRDSLRAALNRTHHETP